MEAREELEQLRSNVKRLMQRWFESNYEEPDSHVSVENGEYVFLSGDPQEASEILQDEFGDFFPDDLLRDVAEDLGGPDWVKKGDY